MSNDLQTKLKRNQARLGREEHFADFLIDLKRQVPFMPSEEMFLSFDDTEGILSRLRNCAANSPPTFTWEGSNPDQLSRSLEAMVAEIGDSSCYLIPFCRFQYMGAMALSFRNAVASVMGLYALGEETAVLVDSDIENYMDVDKSEEFGSIVYRVEVGGPGWARGAEHGFLNAEA